MGYFWQIVIGLLLAGVARAGQLHPAIESVTSEILTGDVRFADLSEIMVRGERNVWSPMPAIIPTPRGDVFARYLIKMSPGVKKTELMVTLGTLFPEYTEWVLIDQQGQRRSQAKMGPSIPMSEWTEDLAYTALRFESSPGDMFTLYAKYRHNARMLMGMSIDTPSALSEAEAKASIIFWIFFGAVLAIVVYNSAIAFSTQELVYPIYIIFILMTFATCAGIWGITPRIYAMYAPGLSRFQPSISVAAHGVCVIMIMAYLKRDAVSKLAWRFALVYACLAFIDAAIYPFFSYYANAISSPLNFGFMVVMATLIFSAVRRAQYYALIVLAAMLGPVVAIIAWNIAIAKSVYFPLREAITLGFTWEAIVMTIGLSQRVRVLRTRLLKTLSTQNTELEAMVAARTSDLTEKARIIADQQMEILRTSRARGIAEMAVGVSHEINNPLAILQGNLALLRRDIASEKVSLDAKIGFIDKSYAMTERVAAIVRSLRFLTQDQSEAGDLRQSINQCLDKLPTLFLERCRADHITFEVSTLPVDVTVAMSMGDVTQVIGDLVSNSIHAVKSLPPDRRWIRVASAADGRLVRITVTDGGLRIPPDIAAKMFDPFFTTKSPLEAKGLGLSLAAASIRRMNGELRYVEGEGATTFVISLNCPS